MNKRFLVLALVMAVVAGVLMYQATRTGTSRVFLPSELAAQPVGASLPRIRVAGRVSAEVPVDYRTEPRAELRFAIIDPPPKESKGTLKESDSVAPAPSHTPVLVQYLGLRPDMFAPGRDVIIDGQYENGTVHASSLLTQCPSKYEAPSPEHQYQMGGAPSQPNGI